MSEEQVKAFRRFYDKIIKDTKSATGNPLFIQADQDISSMIVGNPTWTGDRGFLNLPRVNSEELNGKIIKNNDYIQQYNKFIDLLVLRRFITQEMAKKVRKREKKDGRKKESKEQGVDVKVESTPLGVEPEKLFALSESKAEVKEPAVEPTPVVSEVKEAKKKRNMSGLLKNIEQRKKERQMQLAEIENKLAQDAIAQERLLAESKGIESETNPKKTIPLAKLMARQSDALEQKTRVPRQPTMERQQTPQQFLQENLDEFVEAGKEPEVKEQPLTTGRSFTNRMLDAIGSLTFSGMFAVLSTYADLTNNKDLGRYIAPLGGALGALAYRKVSDFKDGASEIFDKVSKLGGSPDDIISSVKRASRPDIRSEDDEPPAPAGRPSEPPPQRLVEDVKAERPLPIRPKKAVSDADMQKSIDDAFKNRRSVDRVYDAERSVPRVAADFAKDVGTGVMSGAGAVARGVIGGVGLIDRGINSAISAVANEIYNTVTFDNGGYGEDMPDLIAPRYMEGTIPLRAGARAEYYDLGQPASENDDVFLDRPAPEIKAGFADARDYDGSRPTSGVSDRFGRARRVARDLGLAAGTSAVSAGIASQIAGARRGEPAVPATGTGPETKTDVRPTINEAPIILKNDELNQDQSQNIEEGKKKDEIRRGAGMLKPKFIVPSVNIFNKTEQEQYVDDIEFAMFDFVQDDSGGNDPTGTNPILRDQTLSQGLRYQRSGVTVNSLYGKNLPDNPKNMTQAMMAELFLGEPLLPTMKFLFSEEFNVQEFNLSEFEVNNYDVNNELTAIEAFSPYANFTNNQLLDQFIDTSILYGVVP
jgi:hypothetical protein